MGSRRYALRTRKKQLREKKNTKKKKTVLQIHLEIEIVIVLLQSKRQQWVRDGKIVPATLFKVSESGFYILTSFFTNFFPISCTGDWLDGV
jgi:hypothetical protein